MKVAVFSSKSYDRSFLERANETHGHDLVFLEARLTPQTTVLAADFPAVCVFVNDQVHAPVQSELARQGTRLIATRSAGFNHIDLAAAHDLDLKIVRVPAYSPYAVAEYTVGLMLALNRKIHRAYNRVREGNFALEGLVGFDLRGQTVGIIGTGQIGRVLAEIMNGFGCRLLAHDPYPHASFTQLGGRYVDLATLLAESDVVTLHCPLTPETYHLIDAAAVAQMKPGVMLINTSRGALLDTPAVIEGLKSGIIGYVGLDVYEEEEDLFFQDLSDQVLQDDVFARLLTFPNVIITGHQAFFTRNALQRIAETTLGNISDFEEGRPLANEVTVERVKG
jgi:D-lactate dehydrogenase